MFQVVYDAPDGLRSYCVQPMSESEAQAVCEKFRDKYVGKPYPNGKGFYPFKNPRVVRI